LGGGAFVLLKGGPTGPETAKQPEIRLAIFLKILQVAGLRVRDSLAGAGPDACIGDVCAISAGYG
jgi:hypothetical protein